jgi:hypothetical protein
MWTMNVRVSPPEVMDSLWSPGARTEMTDTVKLKVVVALSEPEVPVMVMVLVPAEAVLPTVRVSRLLLLEGLDPKAAVTPLGRPEAASVTLPLNGLTSVMVMVSVPLAPKAIIKLDAEGFSEKLPVDEPVTVRAMVVLALNEPDVPEMVMVLVPAVAALLAAKVTMLEPVVGLVPKLAVTPLGSPEAARVTAPLNGLTSVTEMVSVALALLAIDSVEAEGASEKLPVGVVPVTVRAMVVLALNEPDVPEMMMVLVPAVAALLAAKVTMLEPVVGLVPKLAVTPLGSPEAARVTAPLNEPTSVTAIVSVALAPLAIDSVEAEGAIVKLPAGGVEPLQEVPLTANEVGIALVALFHVPLKPIPERVAPAAMLPS